MMSFVKAIERITYPSNREGFLYALSRRESSSNLSLPDYDKANIRSQTRHSQGYNRGYIGYFQFGEAALYDAGYFTVDHPFSSKWDSPFQKAIRNNDWNGIWTGKNGVKSKSNFLDGRRHQIDAMNFFIQRHCNTLRNLNINEFYGKKVKGIEITESGCCAGAHLVGAKYVLEFVLGISDKRDGNQTPVSHYIDLFAHYDLETCCQRKVRIWVKKNGQPVPGKRVQVESDYSEGKYYKQIGKITNVYTTNEEGRIPVIIRHPGAKIKISVDGISREIFQEANKVQNYEIDISNGISIRASLDRPSAPSPKPQSNKTPQELRSDSIQANQGNESKRDVKFNIVMVEADTQRPITNLKFRLTYKGNTKIHKTDGNGIVLGITAEVGQDIEVSMAGEGGLLQPIFHFKAIANLDGMSYTIPVKVHAFEILVKDHRGRPVSNTEFMIFYRGRQIKKRSNQNGVFKVKMLVGFVYGFGLTDDSKPLVYLRCLQGVARRTININDVAYHRSQTKGVTGVYLPSKTQVARPPSAPKQQQTVPKPTGQSAPPRIQQNNTYTEKQGNPLTVVNGSYKREPSGSNWCKRFLASTSTQSLASPFRENVEKFILAMRKAGISVKISTTYRPIERSYLMYYASQIARKKIKPSNVPKWDGVNIDWTHNGNDEKAISAAKSMLSTYGIGNNPVAPPARSNHNKNPALAIDMTITNFKGKIIEINNKHHKIDSFQDLVKIGASLSIIWFGSGDRPHWSINGR